MAGTSSGAGGAAGRAPAADQVRNVVLVGHSGTGKTTPGRGAARRDRHDPAARRVDDGTTVSDFDEVEVRQQRSVNLTLAPIDPQRHQGQPARHARLRRLRRRPAGRAARGRRRAVRRLRRRRDRRRDQDAVGGVRRGRHAARGRDHQDRPPAGRLRGDAGRVPRGLRRRRAAAVPAGRRRRHVTGLIGLLSQKLYDYSGGQRAEGAPAAAGRGRASTELRGELIEGIIAESEDESLMDRYLAGEEIDPKVLIEDLEKAVARGSFYPVLVASAPPGSACSSCSRCMTEAFPSPAEHPLPAVTTPDGKPVTRPDLRPGRPAGRRGGQDHRPTRTSAGSAWSGCSPARCARTPSVHVSGHGLRRSAGTTTTTSTSGSARCPRRWASSSARSPQCAAGDICAVAKLGTRRDRRHAVGQGQTRC